MQKSNKINKLIDGTADLIEKVSTPATRAGSAVERAGRMLEEGVDASVIALQMTKNSPSAKHYTARDVGAFGDLYKDAKTRAPLTAKQTRALIKDQQTQSEENSELAHSKI